MRPLALGLALALSGCASFSPDGGFGAVQQLSRERIGASPSYQRGAERSDAVQNRIQELLAQPLSAESCVELALLNNRELQARYADLGIAEADRVRAGRLPNPSLRWGRLSGGGHAEIDRGVVFDLLGLLTLPAVSQAERRRFEQAQLQAAIETVSLAGEARKAYLEAVAAQQMLGYFGQVKEAAEAASELARRMAAVGNFSKLAQLREQAFESDATLQLGRAKRQVAASREQLIRVLGLSGEQRQFSLPERLPDVPQQPMELGAAEQTALDQRLDVLLAKRQAEATAQALGLTRATRMVNVLNAGWQDQRVSGEPRLRGVEVELELPLFDFGSTRVARAEALYLQSLHRVAASGHQAQSEVREAYAAYRAAHEAALHYRDELVPLRQRISEENRLRYNGMLVSVFELLADAREQVQTVAAAVEAQRDYWLAEARLKAAISGAPKSSSER